MSFRPTGEILDDTLIASRLRFLAPLEMTFVISVYEGSSNFRLYHSYRLQLSLI